MLSDGIGVDKMLTLIQDGPNVNKTIFCEMNELIAKDYPEFQGLIDLGSCTIHTVYNAFGNVLNNMGKTLISCVQICTLFSSIVLPEERILKRFK